MDNLSINQITELPFCLFLSRCDLPQITSLYFVFDDQSNLVYIGKTKNLFNRWVGHHRAPQMQPDYRIHWIEITDEQIRDELETYYITLFQPP